MQCAKIKRAETPSADNVKNKCAAFPQIAPRKCKRTDL